MLTNFMLQKRFLFSLNRKLSSAFILSMIFSLVGLGLNTAVVAGLSRIPFFYEFQIIAKIMASGAIFFYNYYTKRLAFERR